MHRRLRLILACSTILFALILGATHVNAGQRSRILLIVDSPSSRLAPRLQAELEALGFEVVQGNPLRVRSTRPALQSATREANAVAAVRIGRSAGGVEVWLTDPITGRTVLREVVVAEGSGEAADRLVAVRSVELLRASLLKIKASRRRRPEPEPPKVSRARVPPKPPPPPPTWYFEVGPGASLSPGGLGVLPHTVLTLRTRLINRFSVSALLVSPTFPSRVEGEQGSASVVLGLAGLGTALSFASEKSTWNGIVGAGMALAWMHVSGTAIPPHRGETDDVFAALPYGRLGASYRLLERLRIRADVRTGVTLPRPVVRFVGDTVASWGRPMILASLGLELSAF